MKRTSLGMIRDGNDGPVSAPALFVRPHPTRESGTWRSVTECRSRLAWEEERVIVERQSRRNGRNRTLLTLVPRLDDRAQNGLAARGEHTSIEIHVFHFPFRRDRLSEGDCGRDRT